MARIAYTDLLLDWTPADGASATKPSATQITNLLKNVYKQVYGVFYPKKKYYTDDDTKDYDGLVIDDDVFSLLLPWVSTIVNDWHNAGSDGQGSYRFFKFALPKDIKKELRRQRRASGKYCPLKNVRVFGNDLSDQTPGRFVK